MKHIDNAVECARFVKDYGVMHLALAVGEIQKQLEQPKREWVGLTMGEVQEILNDPRYQMKSMIVHAVEAKLKEKNT